MVRRPSSVRRLSVRPSVNFCANRFFSQANGRISTKLAHDGLQVSVHPGCAQGQGQGQRSRDTRTFFGFLEWATPSLTVWFYLRRIAFYPFLWSQLPADTMTCAANLCGKLDQRMTVLTATSGFSHEIIRDYSYYLLMALCKIPCCAEEKFAWWCSLWITRKPSCRWRTRATLKIRVTGHSRSLEMTPFDRSYTTSY